jgi:formyl-CoA transferase
MGADVIHIEKPDTPPEALSTVPPKINGTSIGYIAWNMNKRGLGLDLKKPEDVALAREIVAQCDVFMVNMRPSTVDRLGLDHETVSKLNPGIVYCEVTGWGHTGPLSPAPGSDGVLQGYSGFWSLNGTDGEFYRHYTQMDSSTGNLAIAGVLAALVARKRTGKGQRIRVSMLQAAMSLQAVPLALTLAGQSLAAQGAASQTTAPDDVFRCVDGLDLGVSVTSPAQWTALCEALDNPALAEKPEYADNRARLENRGALTSLIGEAIAAKSRPYWIWRLRAAGVPFGYPMTFDELKSHRNVRDNGLMPTVPTKHWGEVTHGGSPWQFSRHATRWTSPPLAGEHTEEIVAELAPEALQ